MMSKLASAAMTVAALLLSSAVTMARCRSMPSPARWWRASSRRFIAIGSCEVLFDQVHALSARARSAGVETRLAAYEDQFHAFQNLASLIPEAARAIGEMSAFAREKTP